MNEATITFQLIIQLEYDKFIFKQDDIIIKHDQEMSEKQLEMWAKTIIEKRHDNIYYLDILDVVIN